MIQRGAEKCAVHRIFIAYGCRDGSELAFQVGLLKNIIQETGDTTTALHRGGRPLHHFEAVVARQIPLIGRDAHAIGGETIAVFKAPQVDPAEARIPIADKSPRNKTERVLKRRGGGVAPEGLGDNADTLRNVDQRGVGARRGRSTRDPVAVAVRRGRNLKGREYGDARRGGNRIAAGSGSLRRAYS